MNFQQLKTPLMYGGIGAITAAGFLAAMLVIFGGFNDFTMKALATTFVIGYYSLTTVSTFGEGKVFGFLAVAGVAVAVIGLFLTLPEIWTSNFVSSEVKWKLIFSVAAFAFGLGCGSINARVAGNSVAGVGTMVAANCCVGAVTSMVIYLINETPMPSEEFARTLIALMIMGFTLSIVNFIVSKMGKTAN